MKTKINRIVALLSIAVLCFGFTACTSTADNGETTTTTTTSVAEVSAESVEIANGDKSTSAVVANGTTAKQGTSTTVAVKNGTTAKTSTTTKTTSTTTTKRTTTKKTTTTTTASSKQYCYLSIECSKILDNMDNLKPGHDKYVPSDGYIIKNYKFEITGKETVYDVLKEACKDNGIKLTAKKTSMGIYVTGINNLDEKDCGQFSGWVYRVNDGIPPRKSCSMYILSSGDRITWSYTCGNKITK